VGKDWDKVEPFAQQGAIPRTPVTGLEAKQRLLRSYTQAHIACGSTLLAIKKREKP
jgi:hypothetical protein